MADFFARKDISAVTTFADPAAHYVFQFEAHEQTVFNESTDTTYEMSFDGENVHARLEPTGPSKVINWVDHVRKQVWVRRAAGGGAGAKFVQVIGTTR